jgi:hypothetical protein
MSQPLLRVRLLRFWRRSARRTSRAPVRVAASRAVRAEPEASLPGSFPGPIPAAAKAPSAQASPRGGGLSASATPSASKKGTPFGIGSSGSGGKAGSTAEGRRAPARHASRPVTVYALITSVAAGRSLSSRMRVRPITQIKFVGLSIRRTPCGSAPSYPRGTIANEPRFVPVVRRPM